MVCVAALLLVIFYCVIKKIHRTERLLGLFLRHGARLEFGWSCIKYNLVLLKFLQSL